MQRLPVSLGDRSHEVVIGHFEIDALADAIAALAAKNSGLAILVDGALPKHSPRVETLVAALRTRLPKVEALALTSGERCKTFSELEKTCEWLAQSGFDRGAIVLGIGGGATTDHSGFAAAVYLRGVDSVLLPTTLLAMVDASVGGKTAVDLNAGKNLVGAFHQPRGVFCDLNFLDTLPAREIAAGMAEVVKAGLIADAPLFERIEAETLVNPELSRAQLERFIADSVRVKIAVVCSDERESAGRAILNFGHTVGHAIETGSDYGLLHGEAVSLGLIAALKLGQAMGINDASLVARTAAVLLRLGLPTDLENHVDEEVLSHIDVDKKRRSNAIRFVFVPRLGETLIRDIELPQLKQQVLAMERSRR
ncbi:MAG: 3-dehydroquinate synthase [Deltaproteobacteria bacterium]|nr:3-dehydroquinate synthase [Deltaproteobacteria bacterium]